MTSRPRPSSPAVEDAATVAPTGGRPPRRAEPASCPRATPAFVGREAELERVIELLDHEVLFLIYGVAGIGKSELAYRALELARERPGWADAVPTLVQIQPGTDEDHLVALLRLRTGAGDVSPDHLGSRPLADELDAVVRALDREPRLVFLDDLHLAEPGAVARVLGYLSRRVRRSRLFGASRLEIDLTAAAVMPVVTRLAPLPDPDARRMLDHLARRLDVDVPDPTRILARAAGSPFYLRLEMSAPEHSSPDADDDRLQATLWALPEPARKLLLVVAVLAGRAAVTELTAANPAIGAGVVTLARQFFIEITEGSLTVHDLVRSAVTRGASPADIVWAHRTAARLLAGRCAAGGAEGVLATVEAVRHLVRAGDHAEALAFLTTHHAAVSSAGLDHLLLGVLEELRAALPAHATHLDLMRARTLLRRALLSDVHELLAGVAAADPGAAASPRFLALAGLLASQRGDLRAAEMHLQRAHDAAPATPALGAERANLSLHLANVLSMRGETARARVVLEELRPVCESLAGRANLRWGWSLGLSFLLEEDFASTIATASAFRELALREAAHDQASLLTMLEILARSENQDATEARELSDRIVVHASRAGELRAPMAAFHVGVACLAQGDMAAAAAALQDSWAFFEANGHRLLGPIVGHYLARARLALGDVAVAIDLFERTNERAIEVGLGGLLPVGHVQHARALVAAGDPRAALARAQKAPCSGGSALPAFVRTIIEQVTAVALAHAGDLTEARCRIDAALAVGGVHDAQENDIALDQAEVEICGGDPASAVRAATRVRTYALGRGLRHLEARACIALAAGHIALGGPGDLAMGEEALGRARTLIALGSYGALRLRAELLEAALLTRRGERADAERLVSATLARASGDGPSLELLLLGTVLGSARARELPPGLAAMLSLLGFGVAGLAPIELVVDVANATIRSPNGLVKGRPLICALLARLGEAQGEAISAEDLYCSVWGASEYHSLRNRNTLYQAVNRLRNTLAKLSPGGPHDLIHTLPTGWRLADGIAVRRAG